MLWCKNKIARIWLLAVFKLELKIEIHFIQSKIFSNVLTFYQMTLFLFLLLFLVVPKTSVERTMIVEQRLEIVALIITKILDHHIMNIVLDHEKLDIMIWRQSKPLKRKMKIFIILFFVWTYNMIGFSEAITNWG